MDLNLIVIAAIIALGFIIGALATMAGEGGGGFLVPIMVFFINLPFNEARDTATLIILFTSGVAFATYLKQDRVNIKFALIFASFAILGGVICFLFLQFVHVSDEILKVIFGIVLVFTAGNIWYKIYRDKKNTDLTEKEEKKYDFQDLEYKNELKKGIPFFVIAGFVAYLIGIGGGVIHAPSLYIVFGIPIHYATAMSSSMVFFTAVFNTVLRIIDGKINFVIGFTLSIGSVIGAFLGARLSNKLPKIYLQALIATILLVFGINMLLSFPVA